MIIIVLMIMIIIPPRRPAGPAGARPEAPGAAAPSRGASPGASCGGCPTRRGPGPGPPAAARTAARTEGGARTGGPDEGPGRGAPYRAPGATPSPRRLSRGRLATPGWLRATLTRRRRAYRMARMRLQIATMSYEACRRACHAPACGRTCIRACYMHTCIYACTHMRALWQSFTQACMQAYVNTHDMSHTFVKKLRHEYYLV